jgi:DNA-binding Lrp family transcriptional regulator
MSEQPLESIDTKIIEFLTRVNAPNPPSEIAANIHETQEATNRAIERLVEVGDIKGIPDPGDLWLRITGEKTCYVIVQP